MNHLHARRGSTRYATPTLALAVFAVFATGCAEPVAEPEPVLRPVRYLVVQDDSGALERTLAGQARAGEASRLSFRVGGLVRELPVKVGDRVAKGALVAALDPTDLQLQVQEAQASLLQAQSQQRNAQSTYERTRALYENQNASRQELDSARAQAESATMQARSLSQNIALLRRQVDYARLEAPVEGTISAVDVEINENVQPGQTVATLLAGDDLDVDVSVPESLIHRVERGQEVTVRFTAIDLEVPGVVSEVGVSSAQSAAYPVTIRLAGEAKDRVRSGMAADVVFRFAAEEGDAGIRLPTHAVGEDRDGRFVFVLEVKGDGIGVVHRRTVELGAIGANGIEILGGLEDGERVVSAGVARIRDGLEVKVPPTAANDPDALGAPPTDDASGGSEATEPDGDEGG